MQLKSRKLPQQKYLEEKFNLKKIHKRNRQFFDIQLVESIEKQGSIKRRTPYERCSIELGDKIQQSFMNSTQAFSFKVESGIERYKLRISTSLAIPNAETEPTEDMSLKEDQQAPLSQKIRKSPWNKMLSRAQTSKLNQIEYTKNQERYANFYLTHPDEVRTRSFEKCPPRFTTEPSLTLNNETIDVDRAVKAQLHLKFFRTTTPWNFKQQKWDRGPIYSKTNKDHSFNLSQIPEQKINKAHKKVAPKWNKTLTKFDKLSSKEIPSQYQRIYHSPNCDFRKKRFPIKLKSEYKKVKIKDQRKFAELGRDQICDQLFFRRQSLRQKKSRKLYTQ